MSVLTVLGKIVDLFGENSSDFAAERVRAQELMERLTSNRFHLAVLGQFKRGKSTLLNALLGEPLLPSAVVPVTSIPTLLIWGPTLSVRVLLQGGNALDIEGHEGKAVQSLAQYVTEEGNPKNRRGVARVEVRYPASLLQHGVVLIDTPGIGSTFTHNTDAALAFLPQCDAALFVVSADPPITQVELEFLRAVHSKVIRLFFVLNKADYLSEEERETAVAFLRQVLEEQVGQGYGEPIFVVSARRGLEAKLKKDYSLWRDSGMDRLEHHIVEFLAREKQRVLEMAITRKAQDVVADSLLHLRLQGRALTLPLDDLKRRVGELEQVLQEAEQQKLHVKDILAGDRERSLRFVDEQAQQASDRIQADLVRAVEQVLEGNESPDDLETRARALLAQQVEQLFAKALSALSQATAQQVEDVFRTHRTRATELIESVRRGVAELFDIPYKPSTSSDVMGMKYQPYWVTEKWDTAFAAIPIGTLERLLPRGMRIQRLKKRLLEEIETVVLRNIENARWAMVQNVEDAYRGFAADLDEQMVQVIQITQGAIKEASQRREERATETARYIERLHYFEAQMQRFHDELQTLMEQSTSFLNDQSHKVAQRACSTRTGG